MAEIQDAVGAPTTESEGTTTDDEHLSPTYACGGGGVGGRIKILCSFGGRIVPRPHDGVLKYIGGETRVLAVPRSIPFRGTFLIRAHFTWMSSPALGSLILFLPPPCRAQR
jgi:hypothetical protein